MCWVYGRHPQGKVVCNTGAVRIQTTESAYPLKVAVRPSAQSQGPPGQSKNFGKQVPGAPELIARAGGGAIDFWIRTPDEKCDGIEPRFLRIRGGRAIAEIQQVNAESSPETDIYGRLLCDKCGAAIDAGILCEACQGTIEGANLCTAPNKSDAGFFACNMPRADGFTVCLAHAIEQGLIIEVPAADRCVWNGCVAARFKTFVMCAEHAYEAGLLAAAAEPAAAVATPKAKAKRARTARPRRDPLAPRKRGGTAVHKPDCQCFICIRGLKITETPEVLVAAGKAEADSAHEG